MEFLFRIHVDLRKLILKDCWLELDSTFLLVNIVDLYPDLESLSLEGCRPITPAGYRLIPRLKKLTELNISYCQVYCVCLLNCWRPMCVYVNTCRRTPLEIHFIYLDKKEIYCIFKSCCIMSVLFSTKWHLFIS